MASLYRPLGIIWYQLVKEEISGYMTMSRKNYCTKLGTRVVVLLSLTFPRYSHYLIEEVDQSGTNVVCGFADGLVKIVTVTETSAPLQFVFKPHNSAVKDVVFSKDGRLMVSAGSDGKAFIFEISWNGSKDQFSKTNATVTPLGFFNIPGTPKQLSFEEKKITKEIRKKKVVFDRLFLVTDSGELFYAYIPESIEFDSTSTFEIPKDLVEIQKWAFRIPESQLVQNKETPKPNEGEEEAKGENAPRVSETKEESTRKSLGSLSKRKQLAIREDTAICNVAAFKDNFFVVNVFNSEEECEVRLCNFSVPTFSRILGVFSSKMIFMKLDRSKEMILLGADNGTCGIIRFNFNQFEKLSPDVTKEIHDTYPRFNTRFEEKVAATEKLLKEEYPEYEMQNQIVNTAFDGQYWEDHMHDRLEGKITGFCNSFDGSFLVSSAKDGGMVLRRYTMSPIDNNTVEPHEAQINFFSQTDDITDPKSYSLQDAKIKMKQDRELEDAEMRKQEVRNQIQDLRNEFNDLLLQNSKKPDDIKLDENDFIADPSMLEDLAKEEEIRKAELFRELAWEAEKEEIGVQKLKRRFLDCLEMERIKIESFKVKLIYLVPFIRLDFQNNQVSR
jgi:hypothetical protein